MTISSSRMGELVMLALDRVDHKALGVDLLRRWLKLRGGDPVPLEMGSPIWPIRMWSRGEGFDFDAVIPPEANDEQVVKILARGVEDRIKTWRRQQNVTSHLPSLRALCQQYQDKYGRLPTGAELRDFNIEQREKYGRPPNALEEWGLDTWNLFTERSLAETEKGKQPMTNGDRRSKKKSAPKKQARAPAKKAKKAAKNKR